MIDVRHDSDDMAPGAALVRLYGCSAGQGALAIAHAALFCAAAAYLHRYAWIGLFGAIVLPLVLGCASLLAARRLLQPGWRTAWLILVVALVAGAALALALYQRWILALALPGLADIKLLAASFGVAALVLGLPLWHAQGQARAHHLARLREAATSAELKALQAQVEPHFLYNTLANTRYLARHDPDKAAQMLDHLIAYLHSALPDMRANGSTLGRECELAGHYLALMAIRFGDRLRYEVDCPPALADLPLAPLMLMTLVENAVQHGLEPHPGPCSIRLRAELVERGVRITVSDDGAGIASTVLGSGVGLRNLRERLDAMHGGAARFDLARTATGLTEACLFLPLAQARSAR